MDAYILDDADVSYMDATLLDSNGQLQVVPAAVLAQFPKLHIMLWANKNAVYTYATTELIEWLQKKINGRTAIEISSGNGVIGRALGIPRTDSYMQTTPEMQHYYGKMGQKCIFPPADVLKFEANEAVDHFKPQVVIGAYVTQKYIPSDEGVVGSSLYGVDELAMLPKVQTYITIGNENTHKDKRLRDKLHSVYRFPWLYTRAAEPEKNEILVWGVD